MLRIAFLADYRERTSECAKLWKEGLGQYAPDLSLLAVEERFKAHAQKQLPLTLIALYENELVGMVSLRHEDGILPEYTPWLGSLVVANNYRGRGIAALLMQECKTLAQQFGYSSMFLLTYDETLPEYYSRNGWKHFAMSTLKGRTVTVMRCELEVG